MPDRSELEALLGRIEAATGPDRDLDWLIQCAFPAHPSFDPSKVKRGQRYLYSEQWTASVDDALALVERILSRDWHLEIHIHKDGEVIIRRAKAAILSSEEHAEDYGDSDDGLTPPLAILAALLRALIAESHPAEPLKHMPA